jgi:hypothetical protein
VLRHEQTWLGNHRQHCVDIHETRLWSFFYIYKNRKPVYL